MARLEDSENPNWETNFVTFVHRFRCQGFLLLLALLNYVDKFNTAKSLEYSYMIWSVFTTSCTDNQYLSSLKFTNATQI